MIQFFSGASQKKPVLYTSTAIVDVIWVWMVYTNLSDQDTILKPAVSFVDSARYATLFGELFLIMMIRVYPSGERFVELNIIRDGVLQSHLKDLLASPPSRTNLR